MAGIFRRIVDTWRYLTSRAPLSAGATSAGGELVALSASGGLLVLSSSGPALKM